MLPKHIVPFLVVAVLSSCGSGSHPYANYYEPPPEEPFVPGAACSSNADCGDGFCGTNKPGGSCFKSCSSSSDCGDDGLCLGYNDGKGGYIYQCVARCSSGTSTCRSGYACFVSTNGNGYCEVAETSAIGAACDANADCASGLCAALPGGYCTKGCTSTNDCAAGSTCIRDAIFGNSACLARCSAQSDCRGGYSCYQVTGQTYGVCAPTEEDSGAGGGSGGGGGNSGAGGGGGTGGGTGGGSPSTHCRTYASSYTEAISTLGSSGWTTRTVSHTVSFDRVARKLTDTSSDATVVETYASLADYIDMAYSTAFLMGRGPTSIRTVSLDTTVDVTNSFDSQGRFASWVANVAVPSSFEALRGSYSAWDSFGRGTNATQNVTTPLATEKCIGQSVRHEYDNATRTVITYFSGGTSQSAYGVNNCRPGRNTTVYDARLLRKSHISEITGAPNTSTQFTVNTTATVCM